MWCVAGMTAPVRVNVGGRMTVWGGGACGAYRGAFPPYSGEQSGRLLTTYAYVYTQDRPRPTGEAGACCGGSLRRVDLQKPVRRTEPRTADLPVHRPPDQRFAHLGRGRLRVAGEIERRRARDMRARHRRTGEGRLPGVARVRRRRDRHAGREQVERRAEVGEARPGVGPVARPDRQRLLDPGGEYSPAASPSLPAATE